MFDTLVESGSHSDDLARKGSFFLGTLVLYSIVLVAVAVLSIYLYNDSIPYPSLELLTLVAPVPMAQEEAPKATDEPKPDEEKKNTDEPVSGDEIARPRIVEGKAVIGELLPCEIGVSQESVSLINNGGSISMLVSIEQGEDVKLVNGVSSSPTDVEVRLEPELVPISGRSMYVIKSISEKTGMYQVTFKAPCGKKDVIVRVR